MGIDYLYPEFEVRRSSNCIDCKICIDQCSYGVHSFDEKSGI